MTVSREVDLTLNRDFKDKDKKLISLSLSSKDTYKRYHRVETSLTTTYTGFDEPFISTNNITTSLNNLFDRLSHNIVYIEERICWRELYNDPNIYEQHYTRETWEEKIKNWNFPLGSKYDRLKTRYEKLREAEIQLADICDCCGKKINYNNCLAHHYALCQKCNERLYNDINSARIPWKD